MTRLVLGGITVQAEQDTAMGDPSGRTVFPLGGWCSLLADDFDLGSPQVVQTTLESSILDGEPVTGSRWANATVSLTVLCLGPANLSDAQQRAAAAEAEQRLRVALADEDGWTIEVQAAGTLSVTSPCARAQMTRAWQFGLAELDQACALEVKITAPRAPFWQEPAQTIPLVGSSLLVFGYETAPKSDGFSELPAQAGDGTWSTVPKLTEGTNAQQTQANTTSAYGGGRTRSGAAPFYQTPAVVVANQAFSPANPPLAAYTSGTVAMRSSSASGNGQLQSVVLTLVTNKATYTSTGTNVPPADGSVGVVTFPLPTFAADETGTSWSIAATYVTSAAETTKVTTTEDDFRLRTAGGPVNVTKYGGLYSLANLRGTDRTPVALMVREVQNRTMLSTFVLHFPRADAVANGTPLVLLGAASNGSASASVSAAWRGTYGMRVHLRMTTAAPTSARTVTVTLAQKGVSQGNTIGTVSYSTTVTPALIASAQQGQRLEFLVELPEANLPLRDERPVGSLMAWTVTVTSSVTSDVPVAVLMLDAAGSTITVGEKFPGSRECRGLVVGVPDAGTTDPPVDGYEPGANSAVDDPYDWLDLVDSMTGPLLAVPRVAQPVLLWTPDPGLFTSSPITDPPPTLTATYRPQYSNEAIT